MTNERVVEIKELLERVKAVCGTEPEAWSAVEVFAGWGLKAARDASAATAATEKKGGT
jgi:hypothetical protein